MRRAFVGVVRILKAASDLRRYLLALVVVLRAISSWCVQNMYRSAVDDLRFSHLPVGCSRSTDVAGHHDNQPWVFRSSRSVAGKSPSFNRRRADARWRFSHAVLRLLLAGMPAVTGGSLGLGHRSMFLDLPAHVQHIDDSEHGLAIDRSSPVP